MQCDKANYKKGSTGTEVKEIQTRLQAYGYYNGRIDGDYGTITEKAVKAYQKKRGLLQDGIVGPITCRRLFGDTTVYTVNHLCESQGGGCLGQTNGYRCGPHSIMQALRKFGIKGYSEATIAGYAGTTTSGTGHSGLETAIAKIARNEGIKLSVKWYNFSDLGSSRSARFKKLGQIMTETNKAVFCHLLYRGYAGHYECIKTINTNTEYLKIPNSLGKKCGSPAYCGYMENRNYSTQASYISGISQKSICVITKN